MSVTRGIAGLVLAVLLVSPALAQDNSFIDLRPKDVQFPDNMEFEDLPIGPVPSELEAPTDPQGVSNEVFGPRVDEAYGAFQRGYYLTALKLALPRAKAGDHAAQTLIGEIYSNGFGVKRDEPLAASWYKKAADRGDREAIFALARCAGWIAHAIEQYDQPTFMRARVDYIGPTPGTARPAAR